MNVVIVESPAKAKTINKYLGRDYTVLASYGHVRDLPAKDGSVRPDEDFAMSWIVDPRADKRIAEIAKAVKGATHLYLATDPDREGEAISWHVREILRQKQGARRRRRQAGGLQRGDQGSRPGSLQASPRDQRGTGGRLSRPPRPRLSRGLHPFAGAVAQAAGQPLGRPCAVRGAPPHLRARVRDRDLQAAGILEHRGGVQDRRRPELHRAPHPSRRQASRQIRPRQRGQGQGGGGDHPPRAQLRRQQRREEAGPAQSAAALHHLDPAAGSLAQARPRRPAHHAHRPAPLRRRRHRRRDRRPHHLYAHRRRGTVCRGDRGGAPHDRRDLRQAVLPRGAARLQGQRQERPGGPRGDPSHRPLPPPGRRGEVRLDPKS